MGGTLGRKRFRAAGEIASLAGLAELIDDVTPRLFSDEDVPHPDLSTSARSAAVIQTGHEVLPAVYRPEYLDGLRTLVDTHPYSTILSALDRDGDGPWRDWHSAIHQRTLDERRPETHAFMEVIRDLFDGFLSLEQRVGVKPPDKQQIAPLVKWGAPDFGPYTWPAHWHDLGIRTSVVSMPPAYAGNVALWAALGHETTGHDILIADDGLLAETAQKVSEAILDSSLGGSVQHEGGSQPFKEFAADYWARVIDETASDVCGLLNLGPAAGIGLAVLFIPFGGGRLSRWTSSTDPHPIDLSRAWLSAAVIGGLRFLDEDRKAAWVEALDGIATDWGEPGDLELRERLFGSWTTVTTFPRDQFRQSAAIVARAIAFEKMDSLEGRSLADINTWTTIDEALADGVAQDLAAGRPVDPNGAAEATVYAAHVLSGAVLAMCSAGAALDAIHAGAIQTLGSLYDENPVWGGMPVVLPRDPVRHVLFPADRRGQGTRPRSRARRAGGRRRRAAVRRTGGAGRRSAAPASPR